MPCHATPPLPGAFRRLACSNLSAQFSEQIALACTPLAAILLLGASAADTGYLQAVQTLPFLFLSLPAGVLADRASRRDMMVVSEILRAVSLASITFLLLSNGLTLALLAALGALGAVGTVAYSVAAPALIPSLVSREQLAGANRWLELARSSAFVAGPSLSGAIVGWTGAPAAYVLATSLSILAVLCLRGLPDAERLARRGRNVFQELREGAAFVIEHPLLRPILITGMFFNLSWFMVQGIFVAYAVRRLGMTAAEVGVTFGLYGAGMLAGALATPWLAPRVPFGTMVAIGPAGGLAGAAMIAATILYPSSVLAGLGFFLFGVGPIVWTITTTTLRQLVTPGPMLGRISAVIMTAAYGTRPIGAAIGGMVAACYSVDACLVVAAVGFLLQFLVIAGSAVARLQVLPQPS